MALKSDLSPCRQLGGRGVGYCVVGHLQRDHMMWMIVTRDSASGCVYGVAVVAQEPAVVI